MFTPAEMAREVSKGLASFILFCVILGIAFGAFGVVVVVLILKHFGVV